MPRPARRRCPSCSRGRCWPSGPPACFSYIGQRTIQTDRPIAYTQPHSQDGMPITEPTTACQCIRYRASLGLGASLIGFFLVELASVVDRFFLTQSLSYFVQMNRSRSLCTTDFFVYTGSHSFSIVLTLRPFPRVTGSLCGNDRFGGTSSSTDCTRCYPSAFFGRVLRMFCLMRQRVVFAGSTLPLLRFLISSYMVLRQSLSERRWLSSMGTRSIPGEDTTSFLLQNSDRQGCRSTSSIDSRLSGSNSSSLEMRSRQSSLAAGTSSLLLHFLTFPSSLKTSCPVLSLRLLTSCSEGDPVHCSTFSSWLMVEVPGKRGFPLIISASMQPMLHTSMALEYLLDPSSISGALYQRVAMYSVSISCQSCASSMDLTSPKSQSLASQFSLTSTLEGLTSLWMSPAEWRQKRALAIWQKMYLRCLSARMSSLTRVQRSMSMCQKTMQMSLLFSALITSSSRITLGCDTSIRNMIYRQVRWASVELLKASKFFFRAFTRLLLRSVTFQTWPYAPLPIFFTTSNRASTCPSISSLINIIIGEERGEKEGDQRERRESKETGKDKGERGKDGSQATDGGTMPVQSLQ